MGKESNRNKRITLLIGIGMLLGFILPHSSTIFLLVNPLMCLLLWFLRRSKQYANSAAMIVVATLFISLVINIMQSASMKSVFSCMTIIMYCFCFPWNEPHIIIRPIYFYITLAIIILTQLAYILDISFITNFLDTYYPIEGRLENMYSHMRSHIRVDNMLNFRLGGLYRNPNQCARALTMLMAVFMLLFKGRKCIWFALFSFAGVVLTGSRTGFVIASLIIVAYSYLVTKVSSPIRLATTLVAVSVVLYMLVAGSGVFRAVEITSTASTDLKVETFKYYILNEQSIFKFFFGYLDSERFQSDSTVMSLFDSDYGYLIFNYGFVGFFAILFFNYKLFKKTSKQGRIFFILLLWMVTSTIFSSYRAVFLYFLLLSLVYNRFRKGCELGSF